MLEGIGEDIMIQKKGKSFSLYIVDLNIITEFFR